MTLPPYGESSMVRTTSAATVSVLLMMPKRVFVTEDLKSLAKVVLFLLKLFFEVFENIWDFSNFCFPSLDFESSGKMTGSQFAHGDGSSYLICCFFKAGQPRPLFSLFSFFSNKKFFQKNLSFQRNSNFDRKSRRLACWPLDHHHGPYLIKTACKND